MNQIKRQKKAILKAIYKENLELVKLGEELKIQRMTALVAEYADKPFEDGETKRSYEVWVRGFCQICRSRNCKITGETEKTVNFYCYDCKQSQSIPKLWFYGFFMDKHEKLINEEAKLVGTQTGSYSTSTNQDSVKGRVVKLQEPEEDYDEEGEA